MRRLAAMKRVVLLDRSLRKGDWSERFQSESSLRLVNGRTVLILGYGAIGRRVARVCAALGMKVQAVKRTAEQPRDEFATIHSIDELPALLPFSEVLIVCVPLTPETEGLIGEKQLASLPDNAVLVNISRGAVINEKALFDELASGRIRAGLDVWYNYPPDEESAGSTQPSNYPFHELDSVVMTPHLGGDCDRGESLRIADLARLLNEAAEGRPIPNRVRPERGY